MREARLTDYFDMTGKVVLVTGGSRGLGYEMVKAFAASGADVIVASRKLEPCEAVAEEVRAMGRRALPVACHVGHWDALPGLVEAAYDTFGKVDVLVNNAGMAPTAPRSSDISEDLFDKTVGVNFKGPFRLSALVGDRMVKGQRKYPYCLAHGGRRHPRSSQSGGPGLDVGVPNVADRDIRPSWRDVLPDNAGIPLPRRSAQITSAS